MAQMRSWWASIVATTSAAATAQARIPAFSWLYSTSRKPTDEQRQANIREDNQARGYKQFEPECVACQTGNTIP